MERKYQVFVSSTYDDLIEERQEVMRALLELDCIPAGMELFPAANDEKLELIKKVIDDCDYFIVIIGGRYGSIGSSGKSYTQLEYEYAIEQGKQVIGFLHKTPGKISSDKTEKEHIQKLEAFRTLVQKKTVKYWTSSSDLSALFSRSLVKLIKEHPAPGWVKGNLLTENFISCKHLKNNDEIYRTSLDLIMKADKKTRAVVFADAPKAPLYWHPAVANILSERKKLNTPIDFQLLLCVRKEKLTKIFFEAGKVIFNLYRAKGVADRYFRMIHKLGNSIGPIGPDILIVDSGHIIFNFPVLMGTHDTHKGILFNDQHELANDLVAWFDTHALKDTECYEDIEKKILSRSGK